MLESINRGSISAIETRPASKTNITDRVNKIIYRTLILGDTFQQHQLHEILVDCEVSKYEKAKAIVKSGIYIICDNLPHKLMGELHEKAFQGLPMCIPLLENFRLLPKIGHGGANSVFLLGNDDHPLSVALSKYDFEDINSAINFARGQQLEFYHYKKIYNEIPNLILDESYSIYRKFDSNPSVFFTREFIPGVIDDLFDKNRDEIKYIVDHNPCFKRQLLSFIAITLSHKYDFDNKQIDLLGKNNLAVVKSNGAERLLLLDPHTTSTVLSKTSRRMNERFRYLEQLAKHISA